jgi:hypothetical protein
MDVWSTFVFIVCLASVPLATEMARERGRSRKLWFWIAFCLGPLAPMSLLVLGERRDRRANHVLKNQDPLRTSSTSGFVHPAQMPPCPLVSAPGQAGYREINRQLPPGDLGLKFSNTAGCADVRKLLALGKFRTARA